MASIKLDFVQGFVAKGKPYYYFRKPGCARLRLPGLLGSAEFMAAYSAALAASAPRKDIGANRTVSGTVAALVATCVGSASFRENFSSEETWRTYLTYWNLFREEAGVIGGRRLTGSGLCGPRARC